MTDWWRQNAELRDIKLRMTVMRDELVFLYQRSHELSSKEVKERCIAALSDAGRVGLKKP